MCTSVKQSYKTQQTKAPCGEFWAGATVRPRGMKTTRPNSAARAKELGENKDVAANGLTSTNTNEIIPKIR
jgi:hypothetical protein